MRLLLAGMLLACSLSARKFYDDDPLRREPPPVSVGKIKPRRISDVYDLVWNTLATPGDKRRIPAQDVNTLGEVMDGAWYVKRHSARRMTPAELRAGAGSANPPAEGTWTVLSAKSEGVTPGFVIEDARKTHFFVKFDPVLYPEIATSADVIGAKFFYALGYHTPENYLVRFTRDRLKLQKGSIFRDSRGRRSHMTDKVVSDILKRAPQQSGEFRACASRVLAGEPVGEFRYFGTRADDPNDTVPHEHRRELRGLQVFAAWLGHDDSRAINTLDTVVTENGRSFVRHHLIDFGSLFGSASNGPTSPRSGFEPMFSWGTAAKEFFTFGAWVPGWARVQYPDLPSIGRFGSQAFDPVRWTPEYPNPAFDHRLPEDAFWAAEQVMAFTDEDIRVLVSTGEYTDPVAAAYLAQTLIERRNAIGRAYLARPLAVSNIRLDGNRVVFDDLAVRYGYMREVPAYGYQWFVFDNEREQKHVIAGAGSPSIPLNSAEYLALDIRVGNESGRVSVYLKRSPPGTRIVGIERVF